VRAEDLVEVLRRQVAVGVERDRLLASHHQRVDEAAHQHDQGQRHIHDADPLVIDAGQPFAPQRAPPSEPGDARHHRQPAEHRDQRAAEGDQAVERQRVDGQPTEHLELSATAYWPAC
jgi:hypothetical protein